MLDSEGRIHDLSPLLPAITIENLLPEGLSVLGTLDITRLAVVDAPVRLGVPYRTPAKFICIGLNYRDHVAETGRAIPEEPVLFLKATSTLSRPNDSVVLPWNFVKSDWEVELGVVIGCKARYLSSANALCRVAGYCIVNDLSEREAQIERGGQWGKEKGCDTFVPVGPEGTE